MKMAAPQIGPLVLLICALNLPSGAQQPDDIRIRSAPYHPSAAAISVDTNLVELAATVHDRNGKLASGLRATDFQILDNLKPQAITFFSEQRVARTASPVPAGTGPAGTVNAAHSDAPPAPHAASRYIALFFDDTHSGLAGFDRSRKAAQKLISTGMHPGDRVGIFTGSGLALDFTADSQSLLATLASLRRHPDQPGNSGFGICPTLTAYQAYVIAKHIDPAAQEVAAMDISGCSPAIPWGIALLEAQEAGDAAWNQLRHQSSDVLEMLLQVVRRLATEPGERIFAHGLTRIRDRRSGQANWRHNRCLPTRPHCGECARR
jgi:VWFA-related protein